MSRHAQIENTRDEDAHGDDVEGRDVDAEDGHGCGDGGVDEGLLSLKSKS